MPKIVACFILLFIHYNTSRCQDSLHLISTITGDSVGNSIIDVKGVGDVNGDGYDDFIVVTNKYAGLYLGSSSFHVLPDVVFHYPGKDSVDTYFAQCTGIGDVNKDGYDDFTIRGGYSDLGFSKGKVFVYFGGKTIDTIPTCELSEPWIEDSFGQTTNIGDINKDGYNDFTISSGYNWTNGNNRVYLFWGGDTISFQRSLTFINVEKFHFFGESTANIGDLNHDGFDDIAITAPTSDSSKVYIYYGGNPMDTLQDKVLTSNTNDHDFGRIIKNGDKYGGGVDFCIAGENIYMYQSLDTLMRINGSRFGIGGYINIETGGDINNDGYSDLIIGNTNYLNSDSVMVGGAFVYFGGDKIDTMYALKLEGEGKWNEFSKTMSHADINGDGYDELFILAPSYPDRENPLGKVYVYAYKKTTDVIRHEVYSPLDCHLYQNYPNPFNPSTTIRYQLPNAGHVILKVYDMLGREVATLVDEMKEVGSYTATFDGARLASGTYIARLTAQSEEGKSFVQIKKMLMLK